MGVCLMADDFPRVMRPTIWTPEAVAKLKALWAERKSASECARELGPEFTRNAVIGKVHREGLSVPRPLGRPTSERPKREPKPAPPPPDLPTVVVQAQTALPRRNIPDVPIIEGPPVEKPADCVLIQNLREGQCRFPMEKIGDRVWCFCAAPVVPGYSWCPHHFARCYVPFPKPRIRSRAA